MKSTRLLTAVLVGMVAAMGTASRAVMSQGLGTYPKPPKTAEPSRTVGSSRNGGRRGTNMGAKRAALKARNVKRHRKACR